MPPEIAAALGLELLAALAHANAQRRRASRRQARERPHRAAPADAAPDAASAIGAVRAACSRGAAAAHDPSGHAGLGEADRLRHRQAARRAGRDLHGPGAREPRAHGARADRGRARSTRAPTSSAWAFCSTSAWSGTCPSRGPTRRRCCGACSTGCTPRPSASARSSAARGAGSSTARSLTRRPIASPTPTRCARRSPPSCGGSTSTSPERELEAWIDDPGGFDDARATELVDRLCVLAERGAQAGRRPRGRGRLQPRARARAGRPAPPAHRGRDEPRRAPLPRAPPGRDASARSPSGSERCRWAASGSSHGVLIGRPADRPASSAPRRSAVERGRRARRRVAPPPTCAAAWPLRRGACRSSSGSRGARSVERRVTLDLKPPMGVSVSIDGLPSRDVSTGDALTLGHARVTRWRSRARCAAPVSARGRRQASATARSWSPCPSSLPHSSSTETSLGPIRSSSTPRSRSGPARTPSPCGARTSPSPSSRSRPAARCRSGSRPPRRCTRLFHSHGRGERGRSASSSGRFVVRAERGRSPRAPQPGAEASRSRKTVAGAVQLVGSCPACVLGPSLPHEARRRARAVRRSSRCSSPTCVATPARAPACADAVSDLEKAHNAYVAHKYDDAEARLRALLDPRAGTLEGRRQHRRRAHVPGRVAPRAGQEGRRGGRLRAAPPRQAGLPARLAPRHAAGDRRAHRRALANARGARGHPGREGPAGAGGEGQGRRREARGRRCAWRCSRSSRARRP